MSRQEIKLGDLWDLVFDKINANFEELFAAQGGVVTAETLTERLAAYMTTEAFTTAIASYVTENKLTETLAGYVTSGSLSQSLASYVTENKLAETLGGYMTDAEISQWLESYVTAAALNTAIANKVDKEAGKGLSQEDYTPAEKQKLADLAAPTKYDFTTGSWGAASADGVHSLNITTNQHVVGVFRANGSAYENAAVAVSVNGGTVTLKSEETFAGYAVLV